MALLVSVLLATTLFLAPAAPAGTEQDAVDSAVAAASAAGIQQSVAVVDRVTGDTVASSGADQQYISESIVKLFTVAYYEVAADGTPDSEMAQQLRTMIERSDDDIESDLWNVDIVPSMALRYGLDNTSNGPRTGPDDWGWELITAADEAKFLYEMSTDPQVGPLLTDAMANVSSTGADGFDQHFGLNALPGVHGSKQGWTDVGQPGNRIQIHSVGWTDRYFVAILQTSSAADDDAMRDAATSTAQAVLAAEAQPASGTETPAPTTAGAAPTAVAPAESGAEMASQIAAAVRYLRHEVGATVEKITGVPNTW